MSDMDRLLRIIKREDDPETAAPDPGEETPRAPLVTLQGERMKPREQAVAALRFSVERARTGAGEVSRREGSVVHGLMNAKPPSVAEQREYAASRAWVPPGHAGGWAEKLGVLYHAVIGRPGVALGNTISALAARPLRFAIAAFLLGALALIVFIWLG
jgi:hypothetical protein